MGKILDEFVTQMESDADALNIKTILTEEELIDWGVNVVIYANQLIRSSYPAMNKSAELILENSRSKEASEKYCLPISEIISLIPEDY